VNSSIVFKEWLPDQPALGSSGLIRAENVIPGDGGYEPYSTFTANSGTVGTGVIGSGIATMSDAGVQFLFVQSGTPVYEAVNNGDNWTAKGSVSAGSVVFAQYDEFVIAVGEAARPIAKTIGSTSNFAILATSGTAPPANAIGVVGQFVVLGGLSQTTGSSGALIPHAVQWSSIDQPRNWPTPGSATAIASQSGLQELFQGYGKVQAIHGGDQFGVILQEGAVNRMTYVGPPAVFQFDVIDNRHGSYFKQGSIKVGGITYFLSRDGFYKTDGVSVVPIGDGKVDKFFWSSWSGNGADNCCWGYDSTKNMLYFGFSITASANLDSILAYNVLSGQWSYCREIDGFRQFITSAPGTDFSDDLYAFSVTTNKVCGTFSGAPGTAVIETAESEPNVGGRTYIDAVKPHVESSGTAPSVTISVGYRDTLSGNANYTTEASANSRTGFVNMRVDAKYIRIVETITGNFNKATGLDFNASMSGQA
jgi:hypothetical protein